MVVFGVELVVVLETPSEQIFDGDSLDQRELDEAHVRDEVLGVTAEVFGRDFFGQFILEHTVIFELLH